MLVCVFYLHFARETAGAASTRLSLRPLLSGGRKMTQTSGALRREIVKLHPDCFALRAMTIFGCLKIESRALIHPAKKKPAVIYDGRLFFRHAATSCGRCATQRLPNFSEGKRRL
jgi:hypothetical protein